MKKGADKKGQFYLIGGIIIAVVLIGVAVVSNYVRKGSDIQISDLEEEIKIESSYVMDYALANELGQAAFENVLKDFTGNYTDYFKRKKSHYFIFGDQNEMTVAGYQTGDYSVSLDGEPVTSEGGEFEGSATSVGEEITLEIEDNSYSFPVSSEGKSFYFVVSQSVLGEENIIAG